MPPIYTNTAVNHTRSPYLYNPQRKSLALGYQYWRFSWNGTLSEIQYELDDGVKRLMKSGEPYFSSISAVNTFQYQAPSLAAISDNIFPTNNTQYIGAINGTFPVLQFITTEPINITKLWVAAQVGANNPTTFQVYTSEDGVTFNLIQEFTSLKSYIVIGTLKELAFT